MGTDQTFLGSELAREEYRSPLFQVIPVPLEQTVSYGPGTGGGPAAIIAASHQLERWDGVSEPAVAGIATSAAIDCRGSIATILDRIAHEVEITVDNGAIPVVLGGEHTVSFGALRPLVATCRGQLGIIQLDAHADLRDSYEGSPFSHACVMRRAVVDLHCRLFQFGIRALCREEVDFRDRAGIHHLDGRDIDGRGFSDFVLPADFPEEIYLTLDVDGLDPSIIGATGTPVPGGPSWWQTITFLERAVAGRTVVGFDVVELAPRPGDHGSDFAAAQLVYMVMGMIARQRS